MVRNSTAFARQRNVCHRFLVGTKTRSAPTRSLAALCVLRAASWMPSTNWYEHTCICRVPELNAVFLQEVETLTQADELLKKLGLKTSILQSPSQPAEDDA